MGIYKTKSYTLPSSPIHHSPSSSDFEFNVTLSPRKSDPTTLRPADELFYKGQLLPLHLSSRKSMVQTLLATKGRHSSDHHSSFSYETSDSSRISSATEDDNHFPSKLFGLTSKKQYSFNKFATLFRKENKSVVPNETTTFSVKEKIRRYFKKTKVPLYNKFSQFQGQKTSPPNVKKINNVGTTSFSGNLRFLRKTSCVSSCPSTMPSSPNHSGVLRPKPGLSSTEELHSAIEGAIAHCKNSMST
nr:probable membrane-associated kinase regulator 1 [Tanacetum cinerariifolium]